MVSASFQPSAGSLDGDSSRAKASAPKRPSLTVPGLGQLARRLINTAPPATTACIKLDTSNARDGISLLNYRGAVKW